MQVVVFLLIRKKLGSSVWLAPEVPLVEYLLAIIALSGTQEIR